MRLPLAYAATDLEDILSPGTYRLDLVDQRGEPLGPTVPITIGPLPDDDDGEAEEGSGQASQAMTMAPLPSSVSDTRLVLEANIRATQMAFQHNQRTLELGLRMAETLRDGVQVLTEAQAEVMKSMSTARGFFRNAAPPVMLPPPPPERSRREPESEEESEDDEEQDAPASPQADWVESLKPLVALVTQQIVTTVMSMKSAGGAEGSGGNAIRGLKLSEILDWRRAALGAGEKGKDEAAAAPVPSVQEQLADPKTAQHVVAVMAQLTPGEQKMAQLVASELAEDDRARWFHQMNQLSVVDAVARIRSVLGDSIQKPAA